MISEAVKKILTENIVKKILGFLFVLGIVPFLIFIYGLEEEPDWISRQKHNLKYSYALTVKAPLEITDVQKSKELLKTKAKTEFIKDIYERALNQIKISYDWKNLDEPTKKTVLDNLENIFSGYNFNFIKEQSIYQDKLAFEIYGLYSVDNANVDAMLQEVYAKINKKVLESY